MDLNEYRPSAEPSADSRSRDDPVRVTLSAKSILVWVAITAAAVLGLMFVYLALDAITCALKRGY